MKRRLSILWPFSAMLIVTAGCDRLPGRPTAADIEVNPDQVRDFAVLYKQNCAGCHGNDGNGSSALALSNPIYLAIADDSVIRRATAQGIPNTLMPPFAKSAGGALTDDQIAIIVREIRARWSNPNALPGSAPPSYFPDAPGDASRGAAVFSAFCASCHGTEGVGSPKAGSIVDPSFLALVSNQSLRTTIIAGRPEMGHPDWRSYVSNRAMTGPDVSDVVAWLISHRKP